MITPNLTLSHAEARATELRRQAESWSATDSSSRPLHQALRAPRLVRRAAIALAGVALVAAGLAAPAGAISPSFDPPDGLDLAGHADSVAVGDFNGDAVQDIAGSYGSTLGFVSLWLGTGNPAAPFEHHRPDMTVGNGSAVVHAADLNADGRDDLAVATDGHSAADDVVSILLGSSSGLVPGEVDTVRDAPADIDVGDLDGDGDLDLAVANFGAGSAADPSRHVSVLTGDGGGQFTVDNVDVGCRPAGVAIADLVDDGRADLGVACGTGTTGARILARDAGAAFAQVGPDHPACGSLFSVTAGNFDGDAKADLAVDCFTDRFAVLSSELGFAPLRGPNDTQAQPQTSFPVPTNPANTNLLALETADVNSDGFDDVLAADISTNFAAVVADGRANGNFYPQIGTASGTNVRVGSAFRISSSLAQVIAADVNEDGKSDLVAAAGGQILIRHNTTPVPGLRTGSASGIGPSAATVGGIVNPSGTENANNTTYRFEYGTTGLYGQSTPALPSGGSLAGSSYVSVSGLLEGLAQQTDYHYRIVASNGHGTTYGRDRTFRTGMPTPQEVAPQPPQAGPTGDQTAPELALSVARSIKRKTFLKKGIQARAASNEASTLDFELVGRTSGLRLARIGDVVLAERSLPRAAGGRATTLKLPKSFRRKLSRRFTLTIRVTATDAAGNRTVKMSTLKVR
jgi:VCBS repeat protein